VVQSSEEWRVTCKTTAERYDALEAFFQENNSYEVPEILCISVAAGSKAYLEWLTTETQEKQAVDAGPNTGRRRLTLRSAWRGAPAGEAGDMRCLAGKSVHRSITMCATRGQPTGPRAACC
jgi:hypothetical protein